MPLKLSPSRPKVNEALRNKPRERQAQVLADAVIRAKKQADPTLANDKERLQKAGARL